jgi:hypothetical protein
MRKFVIAAAAAAIAAGPAVAQPDRYDADIDARIAASIPTAGEVEALAPAIDRTTGALLDLDVGPIMDAADPYRRYYGPRRGRTLRDLAGRDDPWFEQRLRGSIYGTTVGIGRMMDAIAAATPGVRRSIVQMEREIERAIHEAPRRGMRQDYGYDPRYDPRHDNDDRYYDEED